jgi:hypothetical protein
VELGKLDVLKAENLHLKEECTKKDKQIETLKQKLVNVHVESKLVSTIYYMFLTV